MAKSVFYLNVIPKSTFQEFSRILAKLTLEGEHLSQSGLEKATIFATINYN
jgi:hypothetical protein